MTLHLLKLSVGSESYESLKAFQAQRRKDRRAMGEPGENRHVTRMWPRRESEILDGGSIYWVIKGVIRARQRIKRFDEVIGEDGIRRCGIVLQAKLIRTVPRQKRPFQGWRYLAEADAPADLASVEKGSGDDLPPELIAELKELGLM